MRMFWAWPEVEATVIRNVLHGIDRRLDEQIDQYIGKYGVDAAEFILEPFTHYTGWMVMPPFCEMSFKLEYEEVTFYKLFNVYRLTFGTVKACDLAKTMGEQVRERVESRLQLDRERRAEEGRKKSDYAQEKELEKAAAGTATQTNPC
ncbi:hypothetical protein [Paenibacillus sp. MBLB4367]|uniref:hypothetical protein n=1 Tax=Paenibacillus sp. MBLB4367 TaxID=3384767 RepID=UPI0039080A7C